MLITVAKLRETVASDLPGLVTKLQGITGRFGDEEAQAWKESLPRLSQLLASPSLQDLHLYCGGAGDLSLEYPLPASMSWADVVLLGSNNGVPSAVIIELKHWMTRADKPGLVEGLIERQGVQELHPSDQVRGYVEYCRRFHSAVQDRGANVHGCVLFTRDFVTKPYTEPPNDVIAANYPIFTLSIEDIGGRIPEYFGQRLSSPAPEFAEAFEKGIYRQDRGFVRQIAAQIQNTNQRAFELLDNQRRALALCKAVGEDVIGDWQGGQIKRRVVVVKGPPGSGKSAVAARFWSELSLNENLPDGDIVFVTTSMSQNTNWAHLFGAIGPEGARGVIRRATSFYPLTTNQVHAARAQHGETFITNVAAWRENIAMLRNVGIPFRDGAQDIQFLVSIVDEAHSLVNTEKPGGVGNFGFAPSLGPQAFHLMRCSALTVFFLDPAQGFRHQENTTIEDIKTWAAELGVDDVVEVSLEGVQFRCAGSAEYVNWIENVLGGMSENVNRVLASSWFRSDAFGAGRIAVEQSSAVVVPIRQVAERAAEYHVTGNVVTLTGVKRRQPFDFRIFEDPVALDAALREMIASGNTARLLSSYSRAWATRGYANPHGLPPSQMDFHETVETPESLVLWSKVWNVVAGAGDYSPFIQGLPESRIYQDPLSEVGCPYAVRGFDYDYVGVLWLEDLVWRNGRWIVDLEHSHESGLRVLRQRAARNEQAAAELLIKVKQAYRIVLTRGLKGLFIWVKDPGTRAYIASSLSE